MIQVQIYDEEHEEDLMDQINDFLRNNETVDIIDIKLSTAVCCDGPDQYYCFTAMIIYRDKEAQTLPY